MPNTMRSGRKNLRRASEEDGLSLQEGQSIMQVVSLRGSNVIEVMDAKGIKSLALFPAKFQRSFWIKKGNFVVVDESGREKALESGSKIACMVSRVLFHDQVRKIEKSPECFLDIDTESEVQCDVGETVTNWETPPAIFRATVVEDWKSPVQRPSSQGEEVSNSDDEDGLPPLEANLNRNRPVELYSDSDSGSGSDHGS